MGLMGVELREARIREGGSRERDRLYYICVYPYKQTTLRCLFSSIKYKFSALIIDQTKRPAHDSGTCKPSYQS